MAHISPSDLSAPSDIDMDQVGTRGDRAASPSIHATLTVTVRNMQVVVTGLDCPKAHGYPSTQQNPGTAQLQHSTGRVQLQHKAPRRMPCGVVRHTGRLQIAHQPRTTTRGVLQLAVHTGLDGKHHERVSTHVHLVATSTPTNPWAALCRARASTGTMQNCGATLATH